MKKYNNSTDNKTFTSLSEARKYYMEKQKEEYLPEEDDDEDDDLSLKDLEENEDFDEEDNYYEKINLEQEIKIKQLQQQLEEQQFKKREEVDKMKDVINSLNKQYSNFDMKRKKGNSMGREMQQYMDLIEDGLFDEVFDILQERVSKIDNSLEKKKYIMNFFSELMSEEIFDAILEEDKWGPLAVSMVQAINERPFLNDVKSKLGNIVPEEQATVLLSILILSNELETAKTFLPYANKDLSTFNRTVEEVTGKNNLEGLRFFCEYMENVHFNEGALLRIASEMKPEALKMLIDEFSFDINEQSKGKMNVNLVQALILDKNLKNFSFVAKNYGNKINFNLPAVLDKSSAQFSIFDLIDKTNMQSEFYSLLLDNSSLKPAFIERIGNSLFDQDVIQKCSQTDIYAKFFSHPSFDHQLFNLGQGYFLYGLLSRMGVAAKRSENGDEMARHYYRILDAYLDNTSDDTVPESPQYHIVGAAIHVAVLSDCPSVTDACTLITRRYKQYINKPNPSGVLPISQVEKDSPLFRLLINNGAIPPEPPPTFWSSVVGLFGGKKKSQTMPDEELVTKQERATGTIASIRVKMREDFRTMREYIANDYCDPSIKMKCETMFLKADKLAMVMEKNNLVSFYDELHFLSENFSNYLKKSLKAYTEVISSSVDLSDVKNDARVQKAKELCVDHVKLLTEQVDLITDNISHDMTDNAMSSLRVTDKFLQDKFKKARPFELDDSGIIQNKPEVSQPSSEAQGDSIENQATDEPNEQQNGVVQIMPRKRKI